MTTSRLRARRPGLSTGTSTFLAVAFLTISLVSVDHAAAAVLAARPGPIDRPLDLTAIDVDRDGRPDLILTDFASGVLQVLVNRVNPGTGLWDGSFVSHAEGPLPVGVASFSSPTSGPLRVATGDINPDDADSDGIPNAQDNCPNVYNPADCTVGDARCAVTITCADIATDCVLKDPSTGQCDSDQNGIGDQCQVLAGPAPCQTIDSDGDTIPDYDPTTGALDNCPFMTNPLQQDDDGDGVGNACESADDLVILETSLGSGSRFGIIRVRSNDGAGGFVSQFSKQTGIAPADIVLADVTGDGRLDIVSSNTAGDYLQLHAGNNDGTFGSETRIGTGDGPEGLAAADYDGDGRIDLVVANRTAGTLGLYINTGTGLPGTATLTLPLPPGRSDPARLLAGRLDSDAYPDLVVLDQGPSAGAIETWVWSPVLRTLIPRWSLALDAGHRPRAGVLADLDGDGRLDLAVTDFPGGQVLIERGVGDGSFAAGPVVSGLTNPVAIAALDYDDDPGSPGADLDLAVADYATNRVDLFRNDGALSFVRAPASPVSAFKGSSAVALFGADNRVAQDILLLHDSPPRIDVLSGTGTNVFRPLTPVPLAGPQRATAMTTGDILQDGLTDLLIADGTGSALTVVTGDYGGVMVERRTIPLPSPPAAAAIGSLYAGSNDYDRDGITDTLDNCPSRYNPPGCTVGEARCAATVSCSDAGLAPIDCARTDPATGQCDSDGNGIGDQCQLLDANCQALDTDGDLKGDYNGSAIPMIAAGQPDYDRDGVANLLDNCPTISNPIPQADANGNGIGDACEIKDTLGNQMDTDGDSRPDYDKRFDDPGYLPGLTGRARIAAAIDNCPSVPNFAQEDNDGDIVGNACVLRAALDNCPFVANNDQDDDGKDSAGQTVGSSANNIGDECDRPVTDAVAVSPAAGALTILAGDGSGGLREAAGSPLTGFAAPSSAVIGRYSLSCTSGICTSASARDIVVAERGVPGNFTDDDLRVLVGNGLGGFARSGPAGAQGDPVALLGLESQQICTDPSFLPTGPLKFNTDPGENSIVVAVEPGTSTLGIHLVSDVGLVPPPAHMAPLPVPAPLAGAVGVDLNRDRNTDLVALSSGDGDPATPNLTIYFGLGNGLFFTDPAFNPSDVRDGATMLASGFVDLAADPLYPDIVVFNAADGVPEALVNILTDRADIDGSGRIDGFDLVIFARAFGASRGEDFVLQADGTLLQSGSGYGRVLIGSGTAINGQDLPPSCDRALTPVSGGYGLALDINLDGIVDGLDLAILASRFGETL